MGGKKDGSALTADIPHQSFYLVGGFWIQPHKRLVHNQQLRFMDQSRHQRQLLLHTVGVSADQFSQIIRDLKHLTVPADSLLSLLLAYTVYIGDKIQIADSSHEFIKIRIIRNISHDFFTSQGLLFHGHPFYQNFPFIKIKNAAAGFNCGRLSSSIVPDKAVNLSRLYVQRQMIYRCFCTVSFR